MSSYHVVRFGVLVTCVGVLAAWGCSRRPSRIKPPPIDAKAAGKLALQYYDTDKDGLIGGAELQKAPALNASIENLDTNNDKKISADEITARIETWQRDRVGKMSVMVTVNHRGRPLVGAKVRFVPEKFLGDKVLVAEGITDESGYADLSVPPDPNEPDIRGVHCGLYRVEITKQGLPLPDIYNTQTILGQEVSNDAEEIQEGIVFDLR